MKNLKFVAFMVLILCGISSRAFAFRVVIDPGHGGSDLGTVFDKGRSQIAEKDVTLLLARQVAQKLRKKGYSVILTRTLDREVALPQRTAIANRLHADAFLSIHMNSTSIPGSDDTAEGIETFILNNATDASSRRLAHLENTVLSTPLDLVTPEQTDVALILKDLRLDANLSESKRLACTIQSNLVGATSKAKNRGVKQALFHVLLGADMPSVLVEAGFLNSAKDRALVLSRLGQQKMSFAIAQAVEQFKHMKGTAHAQTMLNSCKVN